MHMLMMTVSGLLLLAVFLLLARLIARRRMASAALLFIPVWLAVSAVNFYNGVVHAGYSVQVEVAVHLVVFGLPALLAWLASRRLR